VPAGWPAGDDAAATLATAWQRIEHYIAWRFSPRTVTWRVCTEGGEWIAPLAPVVSLTVQVDDGEPYEPEQGTAGGWMLPCGHVIVSATVGAGPVPPAVTEAVRRYVKWSSAGGKTPGVTRFNSGDFSASLSRADISPAMALVNSGAADLLRAYRRV